MNKKNEYQDEGLKGNERIEDAIFALQKEATQEQLAHTLTVIRRRMKEGGQLIVAVEPDPAQTQMKLQTVRTPDGKIWWSAFTSFEEELKGADQVKSTFLSEIGRMFEAALTVPERKSVQRQQNNCCFVGGATIGSSVRRSWEMLVTFGYRRGTQMPGKREMRGYFRFS